MLVQAPPPSPANSVPSAADRANEARPKLTCLVTVAGKLTDCKILDESPPGRGFGAAAVKIAAKMRLAPATANGKAVEGRVTLPITFRLPAKVDHVSPRGPAGPDGGGAP